MTTITRNEARVYVVDGNQYVTVKQTVQTPSRTEFVCTCACGNTDTLVFSRGRQP